MKMIKKVGKYGLMSIGVIIGVFLLLVIAIMVIDSKPSSSNDYPTNQPSYLEVEFVNEKALKNDTYHKQNITFSYQDYTTMNNYLSQHQPQFSYRSYYQVGKALNYMNNTLYQKQQDVSLINGEGLIDSELLLKQIQINNEALLNEGSTVITTFYKEMNSSDMKRICGIICNVVNDSPVNVSIEDVADTLLDLKMFERTGSASNAYVTDDLTFVFNPTMTSLYAGMQQITGQTNQEEETERAVIVHEIMHLLQYARSDRNQANGLEAGACRMYNTPSGDDVLQVDCLWLPWILEASAELQMADYLGIETGTYEKKISYARSYNLSRFNQTNYSLEDVIFEDSINEAREKLNEESLVDFINLLYSIEITQSDPEDFWESYIDELSEKEKLAIRMNIRQEVVSEMTYHYYHNLSKALYEGKINDLSTLFYMMRLWELDAFNHLEYTKTDAFEAAKDFISYQHNLQEQLFSLLDLPLETLWEQYSDYCLYTTNGVHALLDFLKEDNPLDYLRSSNFCRNEDMYQYMNQH